MLCMGCGTPGREWCDACEEKYPEDGPGQASHDAGILFEASTPYCDCRRPAPQKEVQLNSYYECAGCRGKVSLLRVTEENIPWHKPLGA